MRRFAWVPLLASCATSEDFVTTPDEDGGTGGADSSTSGRDGGADSGPLQKVERCEDCSATALCGTGHVCEPVGSRSACVPYCDNGKCPPGFTCGGLTCTPLGSVCCTADGGGGKGPELCNGYDDDCDKTIDVGCPQSLVLSDPQTTAPTGGSGGGGPFTETCPAGSVLIGLKGRSGGGVDSLAPVCAELFLESSPGTPELVYRARWRNPVVGTSHGGGGGGDFDDRCPQDDVLSAITGRSGVEIDVVQINCVRISVARGASGWEVTRTPSFTGPTRGGSGGGDFRRECPADRPAGMGIVLRTGTRVDQLALTCGKLGLELVK
jgi:hypothetical protein